MVSLAFSSLWCSTCLCFYYCVKIVNVGRTFLYRVQVRLPAVVPCLLGLSMAMSWMIGLPAYWDLFDTAQPNANITRNGTHMTYFTLNSRCNCLFEIYIFFSTVAFIIIFITAGAIIASLCRHMYQLKKINDGLGNGNVTSHISAARTVTFLLILYLAFYGALNAIFSETLEIGTVMFSLCFVAFSTFPTVNYVILITGNRKLSNTMKQLLGMKSSAEHTEPNISGV
ncbi:taste receptor type 2 member 40-like [Gastrophryne carolinensis]